MRSTTKELITIAAHGHPLFAFRAIDLDKEPGLARDVGVRAYNTAVLQAGDRKVLVENTTDPTRVAYAAMRALKERVETICFVTGHGETFRPTQAHFHYSHVETLRGHDQPGAGDVLVAAPEQLDRLQLALTEIGYEMRGILTASESAIPADCTVVADIGPRTAFAAGETDLLVEVSRATAADCCCCSIRSFRSVRSCRSTLLGAVGLSAEPAIVIDPLNHFRTDLDKVAVPYYPPHPITERLALTVFPQTRPLGLAPPPEGVRTTLLAASSQDSYRRPAAAGGTALASAEQATPDVEDRGAQALAVAVEGRVARRRGRQAFPSGRRRHQQIRQQRIFPLRLQRRAFGLDAALARRRRDDAERQAANLSAPGNRPHQPRDARRLHRA